jgi:hypothetical protein
MIIQRKNRGDKKMTVTLTEKEYEEDKCVDYDDVWLRFKVTKYTRFEENVIMQSKKKDVDHGDIVPSRIASIIRRS